MDTILTLVNKGNDFLWSFLLLILLCGTGIYYTIRLKFIQVRKFGEGCKHVFGHFSLNGEKHEKGEMSPFQSIMTAIAAQVGTGNLAGDLAPLLGQKARPVGADAARVAPGLVGRPQSDELGHAPRTAIDDGPQPPRQRRLEQRNGGRGRAVLRVDEHHMPPARGRARIADDGDGRERRNAAGCRRNRFRGPAFDCFPGTCARRVPRLFRNLSRRGGVSARGRRPGASVRLRERHPGRKGLPRRRKAPFRKGRPFLRPFPAQQIGREFLGIAHGGGAEHEIRAGGVAGAHAVQAAEQLADVRPEDAPVGVRLVHDHERE